MFGIPFEDSTFEDSTFGGYTFLLSTTKGFDTDSHKRAAHSDIYTIQRRPVESALHYFN